MIFFTWEPNNICRPHFELTLMWLNSGSFAVHGNGIIAELEPLKKKRIINKLKKEEMKKYLGPNSICHRRLA